MVLVDLGTSICGHRRLCNIDQGSTGTNIVTYLVVDKKKVVDMDAINRNDDTASMAMVSFCFGGMCAWILLRRIYAN